MGAERGWRAQVRQWERPAVALNKARPRELSSPKAFYLCMEVWVRIPKVPPERGRPPQPGTPSQSPVHLGMTRLLRERCSRVALECPHFT